MAAGEGIYAVPRGNRKAIEESGSEDHRCAPTRRRYARSALAAYPDKQTNAYVPRHVVGKVRTQDGTGGSPLGHTGLNVIVRVKQM